MKILDIKFKNLNSLNGEWHIDLTHDAYTINGIFVITGRTGSGKTTIFDAVCLALYGQTPRLKNINGNNNEIMSRKTKDCYASVIFEAEGKKYLAHWSQSKAPRSDKLQIPKHTLSEPDTGNILAEQKNSETLALIQKIIGMDFKRFKQAVMLEQGGFDAFLKAEAKERSEILELLTGSGIYGKISTLVYERNSEEKQKLEFINSEIQRCKPKDDFESEDDIKIELGKTKSELSKTQEDFNDTKTALDWLKNIKKIEAEHLSNLDDIEQLTKAEEIFAPDKLKLDAGLRANEISAEYSTLAETRKNFITLKNKREKLTNEISQFNSEIEEINETLPTLQTELKMRMSGLNENESPEAVHAKAKELMRNYEAIMQKRQTLLIEKSKIEKYLQETDSKLILANENYIKAREKYESAMKNLFENERRKLIHGQPCPICGSRNHPYVTKNSVNSTEIFPDIDETRKDFDKAGKILSDLQALKASVQERFNNVRENLIENGNSRLDLRAEIEAVITPLGISGKTCDVINSKLDSWLNSIKKFDKEIQTLQKNFDTLNAKIETNQKLLNDENSNFDVLSTELEKLENNFRQSLTEKNFDTEEIFIKSRLDSKLLEKLKFRENELEGKKRDLFAVNENIINRLNTEKSKAITTETLEELELKFKIYDDKIKSLQKNIYRLENFLSERMKLKSELDELNKKFNEQRKICDNWAEFDKLIGQKDGGKFRKFAQKITLNMLIKLANIQLKKMNKRYTLRTRPGNEELELSVIDNEQGGEIRPTENLSGGEKFIISLALALSLSQISGNKTKIDSLFLDEGFGSLDEESLNTALEALAEIRKKGKTIGIISHVQTLKEKITTQINVIPQHNGTSILEGAGVTR